MGIVDNIRNLIGGSGRTFVDIPLDAGETKVLDKFGTVIKHGVTWKGGQIRLTNRRLLVRPWNTTDVTALLSAGLKAAGAPSQAVALVGWVQGQQSPGVNALDMIESVEPGGGPSLTKPPSIVVRLRDGRILEIGVLATPTTPNFSRKNVAHREDLLAALRRGIAERASP